MYQAEYLRCDAVGLAQLIARREVGIEEALDAALERAAVVNPMINAVIADLSAEARRDLTSTPSAGGPLAGVPFLLKDLGPRVRGWPTSQSSRLMLGQIADADCGLTQAYRRAGLVIFGKTNVPEFGIEPVTEPELFGPTRNPWNLDRTAGGSSGGSAVAVSAGITPAAHGNDAGGSIRIPASCCGLVGLKPSRGRVSYAPEGEGYGGLAAQHALTRTVRDSAALLDAVCTPNLGDPYHAPQPERPYLRETAREPGRLRIGFTTMAAETEALHPECATAVEETARLLTGLGHDVEQTEVPGDITAAAEAAGVIMGAHLALEVEREAERLGRALQADDLETMTRARYEHARSPSAAAYVGAMKTLHLYGRSVATLFQKYDVLLSSTLGCPPIEVGSLKQVPPGAPGSLRRAFIGNVRPFNWTGLPAMTLPLAWSRDGLPLGMQFAGRYGDEATLFRLAAQLEVCSPWESRRPPAVPWPS